MQIKPIALAEAIAKLGAKTPVGSALRSREWAEVPLALRERALFSAGIDSARVLDSMQQRLQQALEMGRDEKGAFMDRERFIVEMRRIASEEGLGTKGKGDWRNLKDITAARRLALVYDMQTKTAQGYAARKSGLTAGALDAVPAQELIRLSPRVEPRDWRRRWVEAGGRLYDGRMIALKSDPIWTSINRFGVAWAPFDWGSGMGLRGIRRAEAERLGLIQPDQRVPAPPQEELNAQLEQRLDRLSPEALHGLQRAFGGQLEIVGNVLRWLRRRGAA